MLIDKEFLVSCSRVVDYFFSMKPTAPHRTTVLTVSVKKNSTTRSFAHVISVRLSKNLAKSEHFTLSPEVSFTFFLLLQNIPYVLLQFSTRGFRVGFYSILRVRRTNFQKKVKTTIMTHEVGFSLHGHICNSRLRRISELLTSRQRRKLISTDRSFIFDVYVIFRHKTRRTPDCPDAAPRTAFRSE